MVRHHQTPGGKRGNQHQEMRVEDIRRLVAEAGFVPVERDTLPLYRRVIRDGADWTKWRIEA